MSNELSRLCAGFFLFAVQPFKLGDRVAVSYSTPASGGRAPWFEGICEKVDLRYATSRILPFLRGLQEQCRQRYCCCVLIRMWST